MIRSLFACFALCALTASAQTPVSSLTFEVASIKPAAPQAPGRMFMGMRGGPGTPDPGQVTYSNMPLSHLIMAAYDVKSYQVKGPSWMDSERFDVTAKVPHGATKEQFHVMLQNLLAERFKLKIHKEKKEAPVYALVVAKGGAKLKESPTTAASGQVPDAPPPLPPPMGKDGAPHMPPGGRGEMMMIGPNGLRLEGAHETMAMFAGALSNQVGRPVVDETGLKGEYDYTLNFSPEGLAMMRGMPMPMGPPPGAMARGGGGPEPGTASDSTSSAPTLFAALQEQLGLKLEPRKGSVDLIVVDSVEKTPTEN